MRIVLITISLFIELLSSLTAHAAVNEKFVVYYSDKEPVTSFDDYDLLVFDSRYHPDIQPISEGRKTILGYISLGEIEQGTPYFLLMKNGGILLNENENWKGAYSIDIREPLWQKTVIEEMIPGILRDGFNGIFIDTLDSSIELERSNPKKYAGMADAAIRLIQAIRLHYPDIKIMLNRAYAIMPKVSPYIDMELGESVLHTYNFNKKSYEPVDNEQYISQVKWLQNAKLRNKKLKIYTLDYADKNDSTKIANIYRIQRANGFIPYVTTISLNELIPEPIMFGSAK